MVPLHIVTRLSDLLAPQRLTRLLPLVLVAYDPESTPVEVQGRLGDLLTPRDCEQLLGALMGLREVYLAAMAAPEPATDAPLPPVVPPSTLPARLYEVLCGVAQGLTYRQIGTALGISGDSAKSRGMEMLRSLGAQDQAHAVALAHRVGLLPAPWPPARLTAAVTP